MENIRDLALILDIRKHADSNDQSVIAVTVSEVSAEVLHVTVREISIHSSAF